MRRVLIIGGAALLIAVALLGYAVLNLNRIIRENKPYALAEISGTLGRKVEVGDVKASLRWGVILDITGVKIADDPAFSPVPIIEVSEVYGEAELLPLLAGHLDLRRLVFKEPQVRIVRDAGGKLNLNEIGKKHETSAPTPEKTGENKPADQGGPGSGTSTSIAQGEATLGESTRSESRGSGDLGALEGFAVDTRSSRRSRSRPPGRSSSQLQQFFRLPCALFMPVSAGKATVGSPPRGAYSGAGGRSKACQTRL